MHSYNFFLFPSTLGIKDVEFTLSASSIQFLSYYGFDYNKVCNLCQKCRTEEISATAEEIRLVSLNVNVLVNSIFLKYECIMQFVTNRGSECCFFWTNVKAITTSLSASDRFSCLKKKTSRALYLVSYRFAKQTLVGVFTIHEGAEVSVYQHLIYCHNSHKIQTLLSHKSTVLQFWAGTIWLLDSWKHLIKGKVKEEQKSWLQLTNILFFPPYLWDCLQFVCPD